MIVFDPKHLEEEALSAPNHRSRLIVTPGYDLIVCLRRDSYVRCHRHPKDESYHVIKGELGVAFPGEGTFITLRADGGVVLKIPAGTWHQPIAMSQYVIYHEVYTGPFEKARDVEYAPWAKEEAVA